MYGNKVHCVFDVPNDVGPIAVDHSARGGGTRLPPYLIFHSTTKVGTNKTRLALLLFLVKQVGLVAVRNESRLFLTKVARNSIGVVSVLHATADDADTGLNLLHLPPELGQSGFVAAKRVNR